MEIVMGLTKNRDQGQGSGAGLAELAEFGRCLNFNAGNGISAFAARGSGSIRYARKWRHLSACIRRPGRRCTAGATAVDPAGLPGSRHDSRPAAAEDVHRIGRLPDYLRRGAASGSPDRESRGAHAVGGGARHAHSSPGVGHSDSASGGLRLAAGSGLVAVADVDLFRADDGSRLRRGRGAHSGRVCVVVEPLARCLLDARGPAQHRCCGDLWRGAGGGRVGRAVFRALQRMWRKQTIVRKRIGPLASPIRRARLLRRRKVRRLPTHIGQ